MYENLMEEVVTEENRMRAFKAVKRNDGAPGIDRMTTKELESHLEAHQEKIRAKLLAGTYVPSPMRRVEIPKPSGGTRMLGIPTVQDRFIQQMMLQALTPIFDPQFSEHSYGFRPGRSAQDAMRAAQKYAQEGKDWAPRSISSPTAHSTIRTNYCASWITPFVRSILVSRLERRNRPSGSSERWTTNFLRSWDTQRADFF
jgi:hypothetical protein